MRRCLLFLSLFSLLVGCLSGCGPIYRTDYSYVPPRSDVGKMCISQCLQNKTVNEQMCQMRNDSCRARAHQDAIYQYENYKHERKREGKEVKKSLSDFENSFSCSDSCDETPNFNICYSTCGGNVITQKTCVAFCGK